MKMSNKNASIKRYFIEDILLVEVVYDLNFSDSEKDSPCIPLKPFNVHLFEKTRGNLRNRVYVREFDIFTD